MGVPPRALSQLQSPFRRSRRTTSPILSNLSKGEVRPDRAENEEGVKLFLMIFFCTWSDNMAYRVNTSY